MQKHILVVGASAVSFAAGAATGFFIAKAKLRAHYEEIANSEIAEASRHYRKRFSEKEYKNPSEAVEALIPAARNEPAEDLSPDAEKALREYQGEIEAGADELEGGPERNIFEPVTPPAGVKFNMTFPESEPVEVISMEEYLEHDDVPQVTLSYFEGDQTLVGKGDQYVNVKDTIVTLDALQFGNKSDDPRVVYIRNKKTGILFEVLHHEGTSAQTIFGIEETTSEED